MSIRLDSYISNIKPAYCMLVLVLWSAVTSFYVNAQRNYYGRNELMALHAGQSAAAENDIILPGGVEIRENESGVTDYSIGDHLSSVHIVIDQNNTIKITADYDPYGNQPFTTVPSGDGLIKYTGTYCWDAKTGLYASPTRKYQPANKRFLSTDPIHQTSGPYSYAGGNPVNNADPDGQIITINWKEGGWGSSGLFARSYEITYKYDQYRPALSTLVQPGFKDYVTAILDNIYPHMEIDLGNAVKPELENILDRMANDTRVKLHIRELKESYKTKQSPVMDYSRYGFGDPEIHFDPLTGVQFTNSMKTIDQTISESGKLYINSPRALFVHELVHARSYFYDRSNFLARDAKKYERDFPFPDAEEEFTVQKANQVFLKLNEDIQLVYRNAKGVRTESPFHREEYTGTRDISGRSIPPDE